MIALEIAQQLREEGQEVEWVGLIDTLRPTKRTLLRTRRKVMGPVRARGLRPPPPGKAIAEAQPHLRLKRAVWRGYLTHVPSYYDAPVTLFASADNRAKAWGDPSLRWAKYLRGGLEVIPVAGDHLAILDQPHVATVGAEVAASIERAHQRRLRAQGPDGP